MQGAVLSKTPSLNYEKIILEVYAFASSVYLDRRLLSFLSLALSPFPGCFEFNYFIPLISKSLRLLINR